MSRPIISVRNLRRRFDNVLAVDDLSFDVPRGQVLGFIGANGAGKTTTMRMLVTLDLPDAGSILIDGIDAVQHPAEVRRIVGWMPDAYGAYDYMTVAEYLDFYARAFGYRGAERTARIRDVMDFTDLVPLAERPMNKLSKGMAQRLCLGRTLLHDPDIMILDEPAAGLDPKARVEFKHLVRLLAGQGKTLFISSHILSELEEMSDALLFIDQGRLVHHGAAENLKSTGDKVAVLCVEIDGDPAALAQWALMQPGLEVVETTKRGARLRVKESAPADLTKILRRLLADGINVTEFHRETIRLEDAFVNMLQNGMAARPPDAPAASDGVSS